MLPQARGQGHLYSFLVLGAGLPVPTINAPLYSAAQEVQNVLPRVLQQARDQNSSPTLLTFGPATGSKG